MFVDAKKLSHIIVNSNIDLQIKFIILLIIDELNFEKDIYKQHVKISFDMLSKKTGLSVSTSQRIIKKSLSLGYISYIKGGTKERNCPNKYCLTAKIFEQEEPKKQKKEQKMNEIPNWCRELAAQWVEWRRAQGLEIAWPLEEYAYHIADSYHLIPDLDQNGSVVNKEKWMGYIFNYLIIKNDHWRNACATPHMLKERIRGVYKIQSLFSQTDTVKIRNQIALDELSQGKEPVPF